jgi:hypothetical protein
MCGAQASTAACSETIPVCPGGDTTGRRYVRCDSDSYPAGAGHAPGGRIQAAEGLKATPGSTWESIEQTRRLLVLASHPEKLKVLAEGKRSQVLAEASRVNAAYAVLSQARCAGR